MLLNAGGTIPEENVGLILILAETVVGQTGRLNEQGRMEGDCQVAFITTAR